MLDEEHTFSDKHNQHYGWKTVDRVYAFLDKPLDDFIENNKLSDKDVITSTYTLLQIDSSKLLQNTKIMYDPRYENAIFTMSNIPPSAVSVLKTDI